MQDQESNEYPKYNYTKNGVEVQVSKGASLPGYYLTQLYAERAYAKYKANVKTLRVKREK